MKINKHFLEWLNENSKNDNISVKSLIEYLQKNNPYEKQNSIAGFKVASIEAVSEIWEIDNFEYFALIASEKDAEELFLKTLTEGKDSYKVEDAGEDDYKITYLLVKKIN